MNAPLAPCPACARHVRADEPACPFCAHAFDAPLAAAPGTTRRLSRAATFAFGASIALTGCAAATGGDAGDATSQQDVARAETGGMDTGGADVPPDDMGAVAPPYGIAPPPDAGAD